MSEKSSTADRYFYVFLTEKHKIGDKSHHTPQHITLVPPFCGDRADVLKIAEGVAAKFDSFEIKLEGRATIGDNNDISVILVEPNKNLQAMHESLFDKLKEHNIDTGYVRFIKNEFKPHVTIKKYHFTIRENQKMIFDHIAVMHKYKDIKTVLAINLLGKKL